MDRKINILLADDHSLIRQGLVFLLEDMALDCEISNASTLGQTIEAVRSRPLDIMIADAHFPDGCSLQALPEIMQLQPCIKILIFSGIDEKANALKYLNAGASGFVSKINEEEEIKKAILQVLETGKYMSATTQAVLLESLQNPSAYNPLCRLTERELQIAEMYGSGMGNLEIANALDVKQNTVSTIKKRIFEKLEIDNIVELIEVLKENKSTF